MEVMESRSTPAGTLDARTKRQARELQALIAQLLEPPMDPQAHPLPDVELSPREIKVLLLLGDKGEMIMTDLASALHAPLSTVTRIVDRLENKELIERSRSDKDRRIVVVKEGRKGRMLHDSIRQSQFELAARMLEPLSSGEREILLELIGKLIRGMTAPKV
jgi:DNA-binding MarR family transcriptional regulator